MSNRAIDASYRPCTYSTWFHFSDIHVLTFLAVELQEEQRQNNETLVSQINKQDALATVSKEGMSFLLTIYIMANR